MKFYGNGIVWDGKANKPLVRFVDGVAEVNEPAAARKLAALGYKGEGEMPADPVKRTAPEKSSGSTGTKRPKKPSK